jgi:hypothetical protein
MHRYDYDRIIDILIVRFVDTDVNSDPILVRDDGVMRVYECLVKDVMYCKVKNLMVEYIFEHGSASDKHMTARLSYVSNIISSASERFSVIFDNVYVVLKPFNLDNTLCVVNVDREFRITVGVDDDNGSTARSVDMSEAYYLSGDQLSMTIACDILRLYRDIKPEQILDFVEMHVRCSPNLTMYNIIKRSSVRIVYERACI